MKCNYNLIYKGVPVGNGQYKVQEEYEALAQRHGETIRDSPNLKEKSQHGHQMQTRSD